MCSLLADDEIDPYFGAPVPAGISSDYLQMGFTCEWRDDPIPRESIKVDIKNTTAPQPYKTSPIRTEEIRNYTARVIAESESENEYCWLEVELVDDKTFLGMHAYGIADPCGAAVSLAEHALGRLPFVT